MNQSPGSADRNAGAASGASAGATTGPTSTRRRRRRASSRSGAARVRPEQPTAPPETDAAAPPSGAGRRRGGSSRDAGEKSLRELVGSGPSQLGVSGALRGRDVNRPTDADLEAAAQDVVIVRRNWKPPG